MDDETIRLALQVKGQADVRDLTKECVALGGALIVDANGVNTFEAALKRTHSTFTTTRARTKDVAAAFEQLDKAARKSGSGMVGFGQAMLQGSRAVQDFQAAGLMGMVNNVEGLAAALGLGAGLSGVATLAFVALQVLGPKLAEVFGSTAPKIFGDRLEELKDKLETLEKKDFKIAADYTEITKAKDEVEALTKAKQAFDALMGSQTKYESASGKAIRDLIVETPGAQEALNAASKTAGERAAQNAPEVLAAIAARDKAQSRSEAAQRARNRFGAGPGEIQGAISASADLDRANKALDLARSKARGAGEASVEALIATATGGQGRAQTDAQRDLAALFRGAGPAADDLRAGILSNRPADIARRETAAADAKTAKAEQDKARAEQDKAKAEADRQAKAEQNQRRMDDEENEANYQRFVKQEAKRKDDAAKAEAKRVGGLAAPYEDQFTRTVAGLNQAGATTSEITTAVAGQLQGALGPGGRPLSNADRAAAAGKIASDLQAKIPETIMQMNARQDVADQTTAQLSQALAQMLRQSRDGAQRTRAINQFTQTVIRSQQLKGR